MPDPLPVPEVARLLRLARGEKLTLAQVLYGTKTVRFWARGRDIQRADWVMTIMNGLRQGWALRGFAQHRKRFVLTWLSRGIEPDEPLTKELCEEVLLELRRQELQKSSPTDDSRKPG